MKTSELRKLGNSSQIKTLFQFLFEILYAGNTTKAFKESEFRSIALGKESGDFESRLATFDIRKLKRDEAIKENFNKVTHLTNLFQGQKRLVL